MGGQTRLQWIWVLGLFLPLTACDGDKDVTEGTGDVGDLAREIAQLAVGVDQAGFFLACRAVANEFHGVLSHCVDGLGRDQ